MSDGALLLPKATAKVDRMKLTTTRREKRYTDNVTPPVRNDAWPRRKSHT